MTDPRTALMAPVDYSMTVEQARDLIGAAVMPAQYRKQLLRHMMKGRGAEAMIDLFAEFIGLSNAVAHNCRAMITEHHRQAAIGNIPPDKLDQLNLPDVVGALRGVILADGADQ